MLPAALTYAFLTSLIASIFGGGNATLLFAGDAMMHRDQIAAAKNADGTYSYDECFEKVRPLIESADYSVVNLETPLGGAPYSGYPCFCAPDSYAQALRDAGFDLFLTANNHTLDRRDKGLKRTLQVLDGFGVKHLGTYRDIAQRDSVLPLIQDVNGISIAFLNYTYGTNGITVQGDAVVDYIEREKMRSDITAAREKGAELVCVAIHWGDEYKLLPNAHQKSLADYIVNAGADMIIGGHPHVIQPMEMRKNAEGKNVLLVYSLGNFISNMKTRDTRGGAVAKVYVSKGWLGEAKVDSAKYHLVFTEPGSAGGRNFQLVDADSCKGAWRGHCQNFASSAEAIFKKHNRGVEKF